MFARKKRKKWPIVLAVVVVLLATLAAAGYYVGSTLELEVRLNGKESITLEYGTSYVEDGAQARLKSSLLPQYVLQMPVQIIGRVDDSAVGVYAMAYQADFLWLKGTVLRVVKIVDTVAPTITLIAEDPEDYTLPGSSYIEAGFHATDNYDGDITHLVTWSLKENVITYVVKDSSGNHAMAQRAVNFTDPVPPELNLNGGGHVVVYLGREYEEPGFTASDNLDGNITDRVLVEGSIDPHKAGNYVIRYSVTDTFGNTTVAERTVSVEAVPVPETVIPEGKVIYLTFDDGPSSHTPRLLEVLKKYDVKATFFVVNNQCADMIADIVEQGHAIGVHTGSHIYSEIYSSEEAYFADFKLIHDLIYEKTGVKTTQMRFPGGSSNRVSSYYNQGIMTRLAKTVTDYGLQYFDWNVDSFDAGGAWSADQVYWNVINGVSANKYSVVLQHDIYGFSVDAIERIIQWGLANGYTFLPLEASSPKCHQTIIN